MKQETIMCQLFNFSIATYYKRKRENNLAIKLVELYFSKESLQEFLETKKIEKFEKLDKYNLNLTTFNSLCITLNKIASYNPTFLYQKEGGKIIIYRMLRDFSFHIDNDITVQTVTNEFISFATSFNLLKLENLKNGLTEKNQILDFFNNHLSKQEIYDLIVNKEIVLPILKSMRSKINQKLKD